MFVIKRDGRKANFDKEKIRHAILSAFNEVDGEETPYAKEKARDIAHYIESLDRTLTVEEIQDIVETKLMASNRKDVARKYIIYRNDRSRNREKNSKLIKDISKKLTASEIENQNANVDERSFGGRIGAAASAVMKQYALDYCMSDMARNNHLNNEIYIHDLDSYAVGEHNCFQRNTAFITNYGIKTFEDFEDGDEVRIIDKDGCWRKATVKQYGRQPMNHVTFERSGKQVSINCTANHRWILNDNTITTELKIGDSIINLPDRTRTEDDFKEYSNRESEMFCLGFIIADGCDHLVHDNLNVQVRLCGEKNKYDYLFERAKYRKHRIKDSEDCTYVKRAAIGKQAFLSGKMWRLLSIEDKLALFSGYMAADGSTTTNTKFVWTSDNRVLEMIKELSALAGYYIFSIHEKEEDTNFKENRLIYSITFTTKYSSNSAWKVVDISKQPNKDYEAWCIEEPITHSFTLAEGIITGNCLSVPFDKLLANGFNTRQTDVRPANSVNTAFQLVAVIFQLQSLMQFGGVSATHLDWTMVPYVRKSFIKHWKDGMTYIESKKDDEEHFNEVKNLISNDNEWFLREHPSINDEIYSNHWPAAYEYAMNMTIKETQQAVEGMYHNLNTLQSRSGNQLPFTSINYGTCTLPEGRMVIKALLEGSLKGVGRVHKTSIFPCGIFQSAEGINRKEGDPNYDLFQLALKSTAKRLYPNYANVNWSGNEGYDENDPKTFFSTMGWQYSSCKTA